MKAMSVHGTSRISRAPPDSHTGLFLTCDLRLSWDKLKNLWFMQVQRLRTRQVVVARVSGAISNGG
jgi:hypothetical protein